MKKIALALIGIYQKYISPYKGFNCAYRIATGDVSCSGYGKKVISRYGFMTGYALLQRRFKECKCSSDELKKRIEYKSIKNKTDFNRLSSQQGFLDCDCNCGDACDFHVDATDFCDCLDIPDCGSKKKVDDDKYKNRIKFKMEKKEAKKEKVSLEKNSDGQSQ